MNTKGITVQPFLFIMALFVMVLVIIFGTKSMMDLKRTADFTELSLFVNKLKDEIEVFYHFDVGSTKQLRLVFPHSIDSVCFTNPGTTPNTPISDSFFADILSVNTNKNLFFLPLDAYSLTQFTIPYLRISGSENPLCFSSENGFFATELEVVFANNHVAVQVQHSSS